MTRDLIKQVLGSQDRSWYPMWPLYREHFPICLEFERIGDGQHQLDPLMPKESWRDKKVDSISVSATVTWNQALMDLFVRLDKESHIWTLRERDGVIGKVRYAK